jgi:hypothetical protein
MASSSIRNDSGPRPPSRDKCPGRYKVGTRTFLHHSSLPYLEIRFSGRCCVCGRGMMGSLSDPISYSPVKEAERIFGLLCDQAEQLSLPASFAEIKKNVVFRTDFDRVYFPIPFKETETASALKGVEGAVASALGELKSGRRDREIKVDLEKATSFLFQSYLATVGGLGKQDEGVKAKLKGMESVSLFKSHLTLTSGRYRSP